MRFRTQVSNPGLMLSPYQSRSSMSSPQADPTRLSEIIRSLKQTATTCVLKLTPEIVGFIVTGPEVGPEGVQIWS